MVSREKFEFIKNKYGHWTSWAIWPEASDTPKSNVGDLSIFIGDEFLIPVVRLDYTFGG